MKRALWGGKEGKMPEKKKRKFKKILKRLEGEKI